MKEQDHHLSDEKLLLYADGEVPFGQALSIRTHLTSCWECRAKLAKIEGAIVSFVRAYHSGLDDSIQPIDGPRALLKAQVALLSEKRRPVLAVPLRVALGASLPVYLAVASVLLIVGTFVLSESLWVHPSRSANMSYPADLPNPALTPGGTRAVKLSEVCSSPHDEVIRKVSPSVRQAVFSEYGLVGASASDYEIDHLVTPGLGGSDDIRNLWPEPHNQIEWNSYVKDQLEDHLHHLVCTGQISLSTAQKDIEGNWISAYESYFNTDRPLLPYSSTATLNPGTPIARPAWLIFVPRGLLATILFCIGMLLKRRGSCGPVARTLDKVKNSWAAPRRPTFAAPVVSRTPALRMR
jgi:hypothetical protein